MSKNNFKTARDKSRTLQLSSSLYDIISIPQRRTRRQFYANADFTSFALTHTHTHTHTRAHTHIKISIPNTQPATATATQPSAASTPWSRSAPRASTPTGLMWAGESARAASISPRASTVRGEFLSPLNVVERFLVVSPRALAHSTL